MDDLISRRELKSIIHDKAFDVANTNQYFNALRWCISVIDKMPSAQQERKNGEWVYAEDEYGIDGYHCNQCGFFVPWDYAHTFINYIDDYSAQVAERI